MRGSIVGCHTSTRKRKNKIDDVREESVTEEGVMCDCVRSASLLGTIILYYASVCSAPAWWFGSATASNNTSNNRT